MHNGKINIGLLGLGYWGKNILRNLYELKILHTACDSDKNTIKIREEEYPGINYTLRSCDIFADKRIDAVAIATPAATHYRLAKMALESDKDVFVEKPLALNTAHAKELLKLARNKKKILMVGHILQYHPAINVLKAIVDKGLLGKIQYIYSNRLNIGKLRIEENILWSFAPHDISAILMLVGSEPKEIECFGGSYISRGVHDVTLTNLSFKNKIKAHIFVSWLHPFKEQKLIVVGSEAMAVFDDLTDEKLFIYPHRIKLENGKIPVVYKAKRYPVKVADTEPLREEMKHFLECILDRKNPKTDGNEGIRVLKVLEEAEASCKNRSRYMPGAKINKKYFLHPSSYVDKGADIGPDTKIWHFSHILKGVKIGRGCIIGQNVMIGPDVSIGKLCKIQNNVSIYKGVTLKDSVFIGPSVVFTNVINPRSAISRIKEFKPTFVGEGATIGANATIVCSVAIGRYAFIGAGAVVTKDIPDYALAYGNPSRIRDWVCECGVKLNFAKQKTKCPLCNKAYRKEKNMVIRITV